MNCEGSKTRGTGSSNPSPSTGESGANRWRPACAGRSGNVLLSFAQFEREVTGERIRDKIAASKKKGMWMGGNVPRRTTG
jgi:hypothetical protein